MDEYLERLENKIYESHIKDLERIILSVKDEKRWILLKKIASIHDYKSFNEDTYRHEQDYLMRVNKRMIYLEDITLDSYKEIKNALEGKEKIAPNKSLIGSAFSVGSSTLGGGVLGYILIQAGLNPLVMIPAIIIPPGIAIYDMLKQSIKASKELEEINKTLNTYSKHIFYDNDAAKRFNYRIFERIVKKQT